jgi:thiamine-monophosphate kinase
MKTDRETRLINLISSQLPVAPQRLNRCWEADAEIIKLGDTTALFTTDEFSAEDYFRTDNPYTLGWNIAVGAISDILAAGGDPLYYAHAMTVAPQWDDNYIREFSAGVAEVLQQSGAGFIGGDFGTATAWRYTATVIGTLQGEPLLRKGCQSGDAVYCTGRIGAGNLEAALAIHASRLTAGITNRFHLRQAEAQVVRKYATACIDSSDGVFLALNSLADLNECGYRIDNLPYIRKGEWGARLLQLPVELLFSGECGEYELLFTINPTAEAALMREMGEQGLRLYRLGEITGPELPARLLLRQGREIPLDDLDLRGRDFEEVGKYLQEMKEWWIAHA